jgi:LPS export ABC transporter permease LptF
MRLLTRYILREVVSYALLGAVLFTFVLFMRDLPKILELVVRDSASLTDVLRIFAYTLPNTLTVTLPTAVLAGILLGLSRLAADSEVTAMRACGIGAFTFVRIVSILAFFVLGLGLFNALYFAPRAATNLLKLEDQLKTSQASFEVQPRVFYEDFKNYVLYVQDVPAAGTATWHHIFLADLTQPANPNVTTADQALVSNPGSANPQALRLHLLDGGQHQISPTDPNQYDISTFASTDLPLQFDSQDDTHISRLDTPLHALSLRELLQRARATGNTPTTLNSADARAARIELNLRFSYPFACIVLMLIGVPLGLSSRRGGKSTGVVLTLLLVFAYYLLSNIGVAFAKSGKLSPALGVWAANLIFTAFGILLLQQLAGTGFLIHFFNSIAASLGRMFSHIAPSRIRTTLAGLTRPASRPAAGAPAAQIASTHASAATAPNSIPPAHEHAHHPHPTLVQQLRSLFNTNFPLLLDEYVMRAYATNFFLSLGAFALLFIVFTFFELIGDIVHNHTALVTVGDYLLNLIPYIVSTVTPLCSLLAVLITFSSLNRSSELTAMKATGISLYRRHPLRRPLRLQRVLPPRCKPPSGGPARGDQGQARTDLPASRSSVHLRPDRRCRLARPNLLLPGLRPLPQPLRQPYRLRVRSPVLHPPAPHLRQDRPLGPHRQPVGLRQRLAAHLRQPDRRLLPALHPRQLPGDPRAANLLHQER